MISGVITGAGELSKRYKYAAAAIRGGLIGEVERWVDDMREEIRGNSGTYFRHPIGTLETGLQTVRVGESVLGVWSGPGATYGPILERKRTSSFEIKPTGRGIVRSGPRTGLPVISLRFKVGGMVVYRRKLTIRPDQMVRPHWAPAAQKTYPAFRARVRKAMGL